MRRVFKTVNALMLITWFCAKFQNGIINWNVIYKWIIKL